MVTRRAVSEIKEYPKKRDENKIKKRDSSNTI